MLSAVNARQCPGASRMSCLFLYFRACPGASSENDLHCAFSYQAFRLSFLLLWRRCAAQNSTNFDNGAVPDPGKSCFRRSCFFPQALCPDDPGLSVKCKWRETVDTVENSPPAIFAGGAPLKVNRNVGGAAAGDARLCSRRQPAGSASVERAIGKAMGPRPLIVAGNRPVLRGRVIPKIQKDLVAIAPAPALGRIVAFDNWMAGPVKVRRRMAVRRRIATSDMTASAADP